MNKDGMARALAKKCDISIKDAHKYISALKKVIMEGLAEDGLVKWVGLGTFEKRYRKAKKNNAIPGYIESKEMPEYYTAILHVGKDLKAMLNS